MALVKKHILSRWFILLMTILIAVPCSIKREIKAALDVPIAPVEQSQKAKPVATCHAERGAQTKYYTARFSVNKRNAHPDGIFQTDLYRAPLAEVALSKSTKRVRATSLPIYILHRQILI